MNTTACDIDDRDRQGQDLLDRINELTKEVQDAKNGWRPLLLACRDEILKLKSRGYLETILRENAEMQRDYP
jgi:hypothetical protein